MTFLCEQSVKGHACRLLESNIICERIEKETSPTMLPICLCISLNAVGARMFENSTEASKDVLRSTMNRVYLPILVVQIRGAISMGGFSEL